jgi:hypothetical protein
VKCSLIDEYVKKPSAHGMSTFNESSVKRVTSYVATSMKNLAMENEILNLDANKFLKNHFQKYIGLLRIIDLIHFSFIHQILILINNAYTDASSYMQFKKIKK